MFTDFIASGGDIKIAKEKNRFCEKIQQTASLVGQGKLPGRYDVTKRGFKVETDISLSTCRNRREKPSSGGKGMGRGSGPGDTIQIPHWVLWFLLPNPARSF